VIADALCGSGSSMSSVYRILPFFRLRRTVSWMRVLVRGTPCVHGGVDRDAR